MANYLKYAYELGASRALNKWASPFVLKAMPANPEKATSKVISDALEPQSEYSHLLTPPARKPAASTTLPVGIDVPKRMLLLRGNF
jgi:hypothetical protein